MFRLVLIHVGHQTEDSFDELCKAAKAFAQAKEWLKDVSGWSIYLFDKADKTRILMEARSIL